VRLRQLLGKKRRDQFLQVATHVTFDEGRDKQARLNDDWLVDVTFGTWQCTNCLWESEFGKRPDTCGGCQTFPTNLKYQEPRIVDAVTGVGGGIDALVDVGKKKL
jgi:hypothetical protein